MIRAAAAVLMATTLFACSETADAPVTAERESAVTRRAVVQSVDLESRQVLLRGEDGRVHSITAGSQVRNLPQLHPGDVVRLDYYEAVSVKMADPSAESAPEGVVLTERAPEGATPGAASAAAVRMVVEFISYDPESGMATFVTPDGIVHTVTVNPEMREFAAGLESGDRVDLTMTEAVAVSIEETN
jgi:hypothetical protein